MVTLATRTGPDGSDGRPGAGREAPAQRPGANAPGPLVTVVIPCYGHARFLPAALSSVAAQTHAATECVVVDDGSPDDVAGAIAQADAGVRVRLVRQRNRGLAAARNTGLQHAAGELVAFLDADDVLLPDGIAHGVAALAGRPECAFAAGGFVEQPLSGPPTERRPSLDEAPYAAMLRWNFIHMHGAVLYRRAALLAVGGFRDELRACEDYDLYLRLLGRGDVALHPNLVAEYRRQPDGLSAQYPLMFSSALSALRAQSARVRSSPSLRAAHQDGIGRVRSYYGDHVLARARAAARRGPSGWADAAAALVQYAAADPAQFATRGARALWRRLAPG